jgi:allantoicase
MKDFTQLADLAAERLGGCVLEANDDFFAPKKNLLKESKPVFIEGKYTNRGKWMDGWETRRRRTPGYDWCVIRLGLPGIIRGVVVDTSFFTGNYPEYFSLEACDLGIKALHKNEKKRLNDSTTHWIEIVSQAALKGNSRNLFAVAHEGRFTHARLKIYPDGGVARLRLHGEVVPDAKRVSRGEIDLVAVENGGSVVTSSDQFYGAPRNLLMPYLAKNMADGWETRRRRGPGHDWVILKLGVPGIVRQIEVDTAHFKGNFPDGCSIDACRTEVSTADALTAPAHRWQQLLPQTKLKANHRHIFIKLNKLGPATHVRLNIYPDGGVSRLRILGRVARGENRGTAVERFNRFSKAKARKALLDCCGSKRWAEQMLAQMPFPDVGDVLDTADQTWAALGSADWLEAFRHHPAIGAKRENKEQSATARQWSKGEQSVAQQATPQLLKALATANQEYSKKFGHVFLICATGKSSEEILDSLQQRLSNDPEVELRVAAEEQHKITRIRLEKLLAP